MKISPIKYQELLDNSGKPRTNSKGDIQYKSLRPLTSEPKCKEIYSFDIEDDGSGNFVFGTVYNGARFWEFRERKEMAEFLCSKRFRNTVITGTNVEYDISGVFLPDYADRLTLCYGSGLLFGELTIRDRKKNGKSSKEKAYFMDTIRHAPKSVAQIGKMVGLPKLEMPEALTVKVREGKKLNQYDYQKIAKYCRRDSEISWKMMSLLQEQYIELGTSLRFSSAGSALELFQRCYMQGYFITPHISHIREFQQAYYGGRVECFYQGTITAPPGSSLYYSDINSMYPYVMANQKFPQISGKNGLKMVTGKITLQHHKRMLKKEGISDVIVVAPKGLRYPVLPCRFNGRLSFPLGRFRGWYCHNELRYAVEKGYKIEKVFKAYFSNASCEPFKEYCEDLYAKRKQADATRGMEIFGAACKILLNGLYGKFGQVKENFFLLAEEEAFSYAEKNGLYFCQEDQITIDGRSFYTIKRELSAENLPKQSNVIWAAYTTAGARILLHSYLEEYQAFYTDTDAVISFKPSEYTEELGALCEEAEASSAFIFLPKMYRFGGVKFKAKGIKKSAWISDENGKPVPVENGEDPRNLYLRKWQEKLKQNGDEGIIVPFVMDYYGEKGGNNFAEGHEVDLKKSSGELEVNFRSPLRLRASGRRQKLLDTDTGFQEPRPNVWHKQRKTTKNRYTKGRLIRGKKFSEKIA